MLAHFQMFTKDPLCIWQNIYTGQSKHIFLRKLVNNFLSSSFNICFGCSKELSHRDGSFEYPQHLFWLRNKISFTHSYRGALGSTRIFIPRH